MTGRRHRRREGAPGVIWFPAEDSGCVSRASGACDRRCAGRRRIGERSPATGSTGAFAVGATAPNRVARRSRRSRIDAARRGRQWRNGPTRRRPARWRRGADRDRQPFRGPRHGPRGKRDARRSIIRSSLVGWGVAPVRSGGEARATNAGRDRRCGRGRAVSPARSFRRDPVPHRLRVDHHVVRGSDSCTPTLIVAPDRRRSLRRHSPHRGPGA